MQLDSAPNTPNAPPRTADDIPLGAIRYAIPRPLAGLDPGRHQVIEASAGTGKTYLIEHRVVDLLLRDAATLEQILVVTFTEKATAELRYRIRRLLESVEGARAHSAGPDEPHWLIDDSARQLLRDALLGFERAAIHTIHGFCHRILSENAFSSRRLFAQTQVAGEAAFSAAFMGALREEFARDEDHQRYLAAWYRYGRSVDDLERLLYRCANQHGRLVPGFEERALASRLRAAAAELPSLGDSDDNRDGDSDDRWRAALKQAGVRGNSASAVIRRLRALRGCLDEFALSGKVATFLTSFERADRKISPSSSPRLLAYLVARLETADIDDLELAAARDVVLDLDRAMVPLTGAIAQRFLPLVTERLQLEKNRLGQFDFHDMLRLVWESLNEGDAEAVCARLRARYRYALIDEFQDTDQLQWQIFRRLYLDAPSANPNDSDGSDDSAHTARPRNLLCVIGDPKQAIYGFRGADVHTYLDAREEMRACGGQVTNLVDNYRSTDDLVRSYNIILKERFFTGAIRYDHPVQAATDIALCDAAGARATPVKLLALQAERGKLRAAELRQAQLGYMAAEIRALLFEPDRRLWVGPPGQQMPVQAGDIFVLTRTTAESNEVAERLRQASVPCVIYKQEGLFQSREAREVHHLLQGIAEPRDRSARFQAWNTRFFGASLSDLPHLAALPDTHPFVARLFEWKALADRLAYERLFSRILEQSGIIERELFLQPSERALTNFQHLFELLLEEVMRARCELHELVQRLARWIADADEDPLADARNVQRMESASSAVQVMTIHRAKGLEAKLVFLYGGLGAAPGDEVQVYHNGEERLVYVGHAHRDVAEVVGREREGENQRLCYVALTRAVARLYLPFVDPGAYASPIRGSYAQINRRLEAIVPALRTGDPGLSALFELVPITAGQGSATARPRRARAEQVRAWRPPEALLAAEPPAVDYEALRDQRAGFIVTSYTRMREAGPAPVRFAGLDPRPPAPGVPTMVAASGDGDIDAGSDNRSDNIDIDDNADIDGGIDDDSANDIAAALAMHSTTTERAAAASVTAELAGTRVTALDFKADQFAVGGRVPDDELPGGAQSGVFLHAVLETIPFASARERSFDDWRRDPQVMHIFRDAMLRYGREPRHLRVSQRLIYRALTTPIHIGRQTLPGLASRERIVRELEFVYPIPKPADATTPSAATLSTATPDATPVDTTSPDAADHAAASATEQPQLDRPPLSALRCERGYIKGFIDLMFEFRGRVYLVDWKSDVLADYSPRAVWLHVYHHYWLQAQLYTLALTKILEIDSDRQHQRRFGGLLYCFVRGMDEATDERGRQTGVYHLRPKRAELATLEAALAARDDYA